MTTVTHSAAADLVPGPFDALLQRAWAAPRRTKQCGMVVVDASMLSLAFLLACYFLEGWIPPYPPALWSIMAVSVGAGLLGFHLAGLYRTFFRYWGGGIFARTFVGATFAIIGGGLVSSFFYRGALEPAFFLSFGGGAIIFCSLSRLLMSVLVRRIFDQVSEPIAIYGAGDAGQQVLSLIKGGHDYRPIVFVDDDRRVWGQTINGIAVVPPDQLSVFAQRGAIKSVILALPSASVARRREILSALGKLGVHVVSVPAIREILAGRRRIDEFEELDVNDLLARESVDPVPELFCRCVEGKAVLVTGAGGSIGSEICRQIVAAGAGRLVLLESSEAALYEIDRELRKSIAELDTPIEIITLLGDVKDEDQVEAALRSFGISTVYHAAAYKHVPIVEANIVPGVLNNVFGTLSVAKAAINASVADVVLVSTDKAVNPTNVMGATKRCAELVLQAFHSRATGTRFSMVRFGNVLASSGSVVPLFREQVRRGGPVTVTHPEVTRYFMTIPEAAQLVIQASGISQGGEVFLLDMGQPVRIRDLAVQVIELMGKSVRDERNPNGQIEVRYTGLRPGEKLYEELLIDAEAQSTVHPKIRRAVEPGLGWDALSPLIDELRSACERADTDACRELLRRLVPQYTPSATNFDWLTRGRKTL